MKKLGKYTKEELVILENMYKDGFTIYKIARDLRRSQKSVRNNLIRLRLMKAPTETYIGSNEITSKKTNYNLLNLLPITFLLLSLIQLNTNFLKFNTLSQLLVLLLSTFIIILMTYKFIKRTYNLIFLSLYFYILMI